MTAHVPAFVWGRDELGIGEMWNSNSVISWLLAKSGIPAANIHPPAGARARMGNGRCHRSPLTRDARRSVATSIDRGQRHVDLVVGCISQPRTPISNALAVFADVPVPEIRIEIAHRAKPVGLRETMAAVSNKHDTLFSTTAAVNFVTAHLKSTSRGLSRAGLAVLAPRWSHARPRVRSSRNSASPLWWIRPSAIASPRPMRPFVGDATTRDWMRLLTGIAVDALSSMRSTESSRIAPHSPASTLTADHGNCDTATQGFRSSTVGHGFEHGSETLLT
jgi:hypothetical protein